MNIEKNIGTRLRDERERLKLDQAGFAALAGITRNSQHRYEIGERTPDGKYLQAISLAGADVMYILAGKNSKNAAITPREVALLDNYRNSPAEVQIGVSKLLAETGKALERAYHPKSGETIKAPEGTYTVHEDGPGYKDANGEKE